MRKLTTLAASALLFALGASSAFAIPSGDRLGQEEGVAPVFSSDLPNGSGHFGYRGYNALSPDNGYAAGKYNQAPVWYRGQ